jgi:signal transduction histidine kinase/DNA-binding response OmpR family regulator/uncharacterized membrane protein YciS (DUF1049 family)
MNLLQFVTAIDRKNTMNFNHLKMGTKLMVSTILLIIIAITTISITIGYQVQQIVEKNAQEIAKETAYHYANVIKAVLEVPLDEARAVATVFETSLNREGFQLTREQANLILKYFLEHRPHFFSTGVAFEPNAFDGKDAQFINAPGHDETGRFIPYWSRNARRKATLESLTYYETEEWYLLPQQTKKEIVIDPLFYPVQGKEVLMTSVIVPILDKHKNFLGITWFDLALEQLQAHLDKINISRFNKAYLTIYSANGTVVASDNSSHLGKNIKKTTDSQLLIDNVLRQEAFYIQRYSKKLEQLVMTYGAPVEIGHTGIRWIVTVNIPKEELHLASKNMIMLVSVIGIVALLLVILISSLFIRRMVGPLLQVNGLMKSLAQGQPREKKIKYPWQDEIAELIHSSQTLNGTIQCTIAQAKAIAIGDYTRDITPLSHNDQLGQALSEMTHTLRGVITQINAIATGDYTQELKPLSDHDQLGKALSDMTKRLREITTTNDDQNWIKTGQTQLNDQLSGEQNIMQIAENVMNFLTPYVEAQVGVFYLAQGQGPMMRLKMMASYAYTWRKNLANEWSVGEGLVGQAALEQKTIIITNVPDDYISIQSGLGETRPHAILVMPFLYEDQLKGVIELASLQLFTNVQIEFLRQIMMNISIAVNTAESRSRMQSLLRQSESQADELREQTEKMETQQKELQQTNEELQTQSEELQTQQEELRQINEELETRTRELERQKDEIQTKNTALETSQVEMKKAKQAIEAKAKELERASQYKSEFLANMSHELRTPLNSLLILSQLLGENKESNLNDKQVEYAKTIHSAGSDLLSLINDILDLSKVEAGKMEVHLENMPFATLVNDLQQKFRPLADKKGVGFSITIGDDLTPTLETDPQRLQQILNNLLSNAFKFTENGEVQLNIRRASYQSPLPTIFQRKDFALNPNQTIAFSVSDSGIGIPKNKQNLIFQAFQQANGSTNRRYGGTGLGLSISRQLSRLLGGELTLESDIAQGSTFTLYLPITDNDSTPRSHHSSVQTAKHSTVFTSPAPIPSGTTEKQTVTTADETIQTVSLQSTETITEQAISSQSQTRSNVLDDRENLQSDDKSLLIIEDDQQFSGILMQMAHENGFKCLIAEDGKTGLQVAEQYQPNAIILDIGLPQLDGWSVMERLKDNPETRHIPVHFMSGSDRDMDAKRMGAIGYLLKPVSMDKLNDALKKIEQFIENTLKNLLIIVDNPLRQDKILDIVKGADVQFVIAETQEQALQQLYQTPMDCIILDIDVQQQSGIQFLETLPPEEDLSQIPVILYADRDLTDSEEDILQRCEETLTVKAVRSPERLLDEATLFLHQIESHLPQEQRKILQMVHDKEAIFAEKTVLIVDDDMRNTFALMTVLEEKEMEVLVADNGKEALDLLNEHSDVDMVLMDIMMPEMDGYETMQKIRDQTQFRRLPIIALTAKAMKGDKAKCIEAGANDYLAKPVDTNKLLSLMRVWLYR